MIPVVLYRLPRARGRDLDRLGELYGVRRWRWWLFAWPLDRWYRRRIMAIFDRFPSR